MFSNLQDAARINPAEYDELDIGDLEELGAINERGRMDEDATQSPSLGSIEGKKMHNLILKDPWKISGGQLRGNDVVY